MRQLLFLNPELQDGINVTVRRGTKWADAAFGEDLEIRDTTTNEVKGYAKVVDTKVIPFLTIPDEDLALEHDSDCKTYQGLYHAMRRAYDGFHYMEDVTVLKFQVV